VIGDRFDEAMSGAVARGDSQLSERLDSLVRHRLPAAIAIVTPTATTFASRGVGEHSTFEIGSISKGVTGLLYHDALARGEIAADTRLGDVLPLGACAAASVPLAALSTHQSGLPRLPAAVATFRASIDLWRRGSNPYGHSLGELLDQARTAEVGQPRARYSNFGFMLLGHAVAAAAGVTYNELLRMRITEPLQLRDTYVPATANEIRADAVAGTTRRGRAREPWTGEAVGPAGGIRSTISDMARLTTALLDGSAPGLDALTPVTPFGPLVQIGAAWITSNTKGRAITWHNGATGGFVAWLGVDRAAGVGAVVLSSGTSSVDRAGFALVSPAS
jgi:CubicO group peptidase (beta-lactamase class C family)